MAQKANPTMLGLLDGKIALVTGAGHGIGRGHALELAKHGATVIVNDLGSNVSGEGAGGDADVVVRKAAIVGMTLTLMRPTSVISSPPTCSRPAPPASAWAADGIMT